MAPLISERDEYDEVRRQILLLSEFALGYGPTPSRTYCDNQAVVFVMRKRDLM